jgi:predicted aspartyl protease
MSKSFLSFLMLPGIHLPGFVVSLLLLATTGFSQSADPSPAYVIDSLLAHKSYFAARDLYEKEGTALEEAKRLEVGAVIDNVFNRLEASNEKIAALQRMGKQLDDSTHLYLLELQQANYAKLFQYKAASDCIETILTRYPQLLKEDQLNDFRNTQNIWSALADAPPQEVLVREHTLLHMERDKANLYNLEVRHDTVTIGFIFDTGANISTVTETTAGRLGMRLTDASIEVNSITGIKVQSKLAVCPEFRLGGIIVKNAVFLVFPDSALAIPQIAYQINGIIGFPVIEAMKEVQITRSGEFIVPIERGTTTASNMALDFLTPIIQLNGEHYTFDSGASNTMLYKTYFEKHKKSVCKRSKEKELEYAGAGGKILRNGYQITWHPVVNGKRLNLEKVMVFSDVLREHENDFYGNVGQDLIQSFEKMTLNFEGMFIRFE